VVCFNTYISLVEMRQPHRAGDLLAYSSTIVQSSSEYEDTPWLLYDGHFRRQAATKPGKAWAEIDASLWTMYFSRARPKHRQLENSPSISTGLRWENKPRYWRQSARDKPYGSPICRRWNSAMGCTLQQCNYRYVCTHCLSTDHTMLKCPSAGDRGSWAFRPDWQY